MCGEENNGSVRVRRAVGFREQGGRQRLGPSKEFTLRGGIPAWGVV